MLKGVTSLLAAWVFMGWTGVAHAGLMCDAAYADNWVPASQPPSSCELGSTTIPDDFQVNIDNLFGYSDWLGIFGGGEGTPSTGGHHTHTWAGDYMMHVLTADFPGTPETYVAYMTDEKPDPFYLYNWTTPYSTAEGELIGVTVIRTYFRSDPEPPQMPTPATLVLFGIGLAGLVWTRRKKA